MREQIKARLRATQAAYREDRGELAADRQEAIIDAIRDGMGDESIAREMELRPHQVQAILASIARDLIRNGRKDQP